MLDIQKHRLWLEIISSNSFRLFKQKSRYQKKFYDVLFNRLKEIAESYKLIINNDTVDEYVHHGLAKRAFTRTWTLSDDVVVGDVSFADGLLTIKLNRVIPDHQKKKVYEIL